jgi:hypothetical protein
MSSAETETDTDTEPAGVVAFVTIPNESAIASAATVNEVSIEVISFAERAAGRDACQGDRVT